jgi:NitT/TauT family transport system permease protein
MKARTDWPAIYGPLVTVAVLLCLGQAVVVVNALPSHLLPSPLQVLERMWSGVVAPGDMLPHIGATLAAAAMGYVLGAAVALTMAVLLSEWESIERAVYPVVLFFQSIPKVSIAPLIFIWAGFGMRSQVALVALICFFPLFTAAFAGLKAVDPNLVALYRVATAGRLHTLIHLKVPAAAGAMFVGLQIAVVFALVGCVVMEFINATQGVGFLIVNSSNTLDTPTSVAAMVLLGLLGLAGSAGMRALRRRVVFWEKDPQQAAAVTTREQAL